MSEFKMYGPFELEAKIHVTNGERFAVATCGLGAGTIPTGEELSERLVRAEKEIKEQLGDGWRLCTKREFFIEMTGSNIKVAMPGGEDWSVE